MNPKNGQAMVEVRPETTGRHLSLQRNISGAKHPYVNGRFPFGADPLNGPVFKYAKEFDLRGKGHVADFVKKDAASLRTFEASLVTAHGAGKRAFLVPEQFRFQQLSGNS
jgi:hypothetical protein